LNILLEEHQEILCFSRYKFTNYPSGLSLSDSNSTHAIDLNEYVQFSGNEIYYSIVSNVGKPPQKYQSIHILLSNDEISINSRHYVVFQFSTKNSDITLKLN
jgi:hypothetical protein